MGHCYGNDLRRRAVEAITGGLSARGAAARFRVAPATAIHWRRRETGSIEPDRQGQPPGSKLDAHEALLVAQTKAMTLAEIGENGVVKQVCRTHCTAHGLRKAGARRLAEAGATEFEVMSFLGHGTAREASRYCKAASRAKLADAGIAKLTDKTATNLSNLDDRLDKSGSQAIDYE